MTIYLSYFLDFSIFISVGRDQTRCPHISKIAETVSKNKSESKWKDSSGVDGWSLGVFLPDPRFRPMVTKLFGAALGPRGVETGPDWCHDPVCSTSERVETYTGWIGGVIPKQTCELENRVKSQCARYVEPRVFLRGEELFSKWVVVLLCYLGKSLILPLLSRQSFHVEPSTLSLEAMPTLAI